MKSKKHLHFIGIGGVAMGGLARAFSRAGFKVTGSDSSHIYPPMSTYLKNNKVRYYTPFNAEKIGQPNKIIIGNAHYAHNNPEVVYARENKIAFEHFPRLVEKYLIKKNSVVVAGNYGKTTITTMVTWILKQAGKNPSYLLGGIPLNFHHGAALTKSNWSVVEGDEYPAASPWDFSPKFLFYHPQYLILTSAEWDHMDIYKTKKSYLDAFKKLVASMPRQGLIVAKRGGENLKEILKEAKCRIVYYSLNVDSKIGEFETSLLGEFNLENWMAALILAQELKIPLKILQKAVKKFRGVKRRLEIRLAKNGVTLIDDFAHSPSKAKQSVNALLRHFPKSRIFIILEPNRGGRSIKCLKNYKNIFKGIYKVIVPKLTEYKKNPEIIDVSGKELAEFIRSTHKLKGGVVYQPSHQKIFDSLLNSVKPGDVIAFLGPRSFGGLIDKIEKKLKT